MFISVLLFAINYSFMLLLMTIKYKSYSIYYSRKCEKCPPKNDILMMASVSFDTNHVSLMYLLMVKFDFDDNIF